MFRYLPDLPPDTPNTWTVCDGFHADNQGNYRTGWMAADYSAIGSDIDFAWGKAYVTAAGSVGAVLIHPGNTVSPAINREMYVLSGGTWAQRRNATTQIRTCNAAICQYGNITLVGTDGLILQRDATGSSNFATIASSPTAITLLSTPLNIIVALGDSSYLSGDGSDEWAASAIGDYTDWTGATSASGNLRQVPGPVVGGGLIGNDVIAFKRRGVLRGEYVGGTTKWVWRLIHPTYGAWGPEAICSAEGRLYFYGPAGFFSFDGANFERLDHGIDTTLLTTIVQPYGLVGSNNDRFVKLIYDPLTSRVCFFNTGAGASGVSSGNGEHFSYNIRSGAWGYQSTITDTDAVTGSTANVILDDGVYLNSFNSSGVWTYNTHLFVYANNSDAVRALTTEVSSSLSNYVPKLRTYRLGKQNQMTEVTRAVPLWTLSGGAGTDLSGATTKTATPYQSDSVMEAETAKTAVTLSTDLYRADYTLSSRYQSVEIKINCEAAISGVEFEARSAGRN